MSITTQQPNSPTTKQLPSDVLLATRGASKKFCKKLKRSMAYGILDLSKNLMGIRPNTTRLRKEEFWAVDEVSFALRRGESVGLIGVNGSGKTTLLRMITGIFPPDKGEIFTRGRVGALIALGAGFHGHFTGRENIYLNGTVLGMSREEIDAKYDEIVAFADIGDFIDAPVVTYSSGMRVRLGFSVAANTDPDLLLVDEVIAVGDVGFRMKCYNHILKLMDRGTSVVLVTHAVEKLSRITNRAVVMDHGRVAYDGDLGQGIAVYELLTNVDEQAKVAVSEKDTRIDKVRLLDEEGNERRKFTTGETITAEITLATQEPVENARLVAAIESPVMGRLGAFSTPYSGFEFDLVPPTTAIRLRLPAIPLLIGGYWLVLNLYGPGIEDFLDRQTPAASFHIVGPATNAFGYGVNLTFLFEHEWELV